MAVNMTAQNPNPTQTQRQKFDVVFQYLSKNEQLDFLALILKASKYYDLYKEYVEKARKIIVDRQIDYEHWYDELGRERDGQIAEILSIFTGELKRLIEELPSPFELLDKAMEKVFPINIEEDKKEEEEE